MTMFLSAALDLYLEELAATWGTKLREAIGICLPSLDFSFLVLTGKSLNWTL